MLIIQAPTSKHGVASLNILSGPIKKMFRFILSSCVGGSTRASKHMEDTLVDTQIRCQHNAFTDLATTTGVNIGLFSDGVNDNRVNE